MVKREFDSKLRKVGNSYVVTVPANVIKRFNLKEGKFVKIVLEIEEDDKK